MRSVTILFIYFVIFSFTGCTQTIKLIKVNPATIKGFNSENSNDNGVRTLDVTLRLSGKARTAKFPLEIDAVNAASKPKLLDQVITVDAAAFPKKRKSTKDVVYKVNVQLSALDCLKSDEEFEIYEQGPKPANAPKVSIPHFTNPAPASPTVALKDDSSIISIQKDDVGTTKTIMLTVVLFGTAQPAADMPLKFSIPSYVHSVYEPEILNKVSILIPRTVFPSDGCPVKIKVPLAIQFKEVEKGSEERIPILLSGDDLHAHNMIFRPDKSPVKTEKEETTKGTAFTHACANRNFSIKLKADSSGGQLEVSEEITKKNGIYQYNNFFHTGDFAQWFFNVFGIGQNKNPCNDCANCVNYIAERVNEELLVIKKTVTENRTLTDVKSPSSKADTTKETDKKKEVNSSQEAAAPDTINYKSTISYADTSLYTLEINRLKTKTDIKLCKDPKKGKDSCNSYSVAGDLDHDSYSRLIGQMLQKFRGEEAVAVSKISPSPDVQFESYSKALEEKNPKEKTEAEKHLSEILDNDSLTHTKVGILHLKDSLIDVYDENGIFLKKTKIDSVMFSIEDGKLARRQLYVETKDGTFTNKDAPISVLRINDRGDDYLVNEEPGQTTLIRLKDVLKYRAYGGYIPDDLENGVITAKKPATILSAASNLNSLINFAIFTDLPGLLGRRANGIINSDITGRFITNTGNVSNLDLTPLAFIEPNIVLSKFDSKFKSIDSADIKVDNVNHVDTVDRMQLIQTAWLKGSVKFNLFSLKLRSSQYFQLNIGARINVVNADSLYKKDADIIFFDYYPEISYSIKRLTNFGADLSLRWLFQRLADKESFANKEWEIIFNPQVSFYFYPSSNSNNRLYLRFNYFANRDKLANNFYQLQLGYKTSLKLSK